MQHVREGLAHFAGVREQRGAEAGADTLAKFRADRGHCRATDRVAVGELGADGLIAIATNCAAAAGIEALIGRQIGDPFGHRRAVSFHGLVDLRDTEGAAAERAQCQDATSRGVAQQPVQIEIVRDAGLRDEEGGVRLAPRQGRSEA